MSRRERVVDDPHLHGLDEGERTAGESVQEIEDRIAPVRMLRVAGRQIDVRLLLPAAERRARHEQPLERCPAVRRMPARAAAESRGTGGSCRRTRARRAGRRRETPASAAANTADAGADRLSRAAVIVENAMPATLNRPCRHGSARLGVAVLLGAAALLGLAYGAGRAFGDAAPAAASRTATCSRTRSQAPLHFVVYLPNGYDAGHDAISRSSISCTDCPRPRRPTAASASSSGRST